MQTAKNGQGGEATFGYEEKTNIWIGNCGQNTTRYYVAQISQKDGMGNESILLYNLQQAWSRAEASAPECATNFEFYGYGQVNKQIQETRNNITTVYQSAENKYHQCGNGNGAALACSDTNGSKDPRKGRIYQSITAGPVAGTDSLQVNITWSTATVLGTQWVFRADETHLLDGNAQKTVFSYQTDHQNGYQYGNITEVKTFSDNGATLVRTAETYYYPTTTTTGGPYIVNRPALQNLKNEIGTCVGQIRMLYDNNGSYQDPPSKGDLTISRTSYSACCGTPWSQTSFGYDAWGNQLSLTNPLGNVSSTAYDTSGGWPKLFVWPVSTTQPLVGSTSYTWDKVLGQVTGVTDPNGVTTNYEYDQWGRKKSEIRFGDSITYPTVRWIYTDYVNAASPFWVREEHRDNPSNDSNGNPIAATYLESRTYFDGLGRVVQTQGEGTSTSESIVTSTQYNPLGLASIQLTPSIFAGGLGAYRTPDWTAHRHEFTYDGLGRVLVDAVKTGNSIVSRVRTFYAGRKTVVLDELNHQTIQETDGLGRMTSVKQYKGVYASQPNWSAPVYAQSTYGYDAADRLVDVWDSDNNLSLECSLLGRGKTN